MRVTESTVRYWGSSYKKELEQKRKLGKTVPNVKELPVAKRGRPLLIGYKLDSEVKAYLRCVREGGGIVTSSITIAAATAIVKKHDTHLLAEFGGPILLSKNWAKSLLYRMQFVKRRGSSTVHNFEELKNQFLTDIEAVVTMEDIPKEMIINWDHTGINTVPTSSWTMDKKGAKQIEITGLDDKRQITVVVCGTLSGEVLPFQLI